MGKPLFQDIIPPDRRSIKRVPIPNRSNRTNQAARENHSIGVDIKRMDAPQPVSIRHLSVPDDESPDHKETRYKPEPEQKIPPPVRENLSQENFSHQHPPLRRVPFYKEEDPYRRRFPWKTTIVFICAAAVTIGTYLTLSHFAKATIIITPKVQHITLNTPFTGIQVVTSTTVISNASTTDQIPYQVISVSKDGAMSVAASKQTNVATYATGKIIIFNDYSTSPQKLVDRTRFETPNGLIYRISSPVTVPGKKGQTPGSVAAVVTADKAGAQYNIGLSDFVLPGLSGTAAYKGIYARSQTTMTGGFLGTEPAIDTATLAATQATIDAELESVLLQQIKQQIPQSDILLPGAYTITYQHLASTAASSTPNQGVVHEEGTIHAFVFSANQLAHTFSEIGASSTSATATSSIAWYINNASDLKFSFATSSTSNPSSEPWNFSSLPFTINGSTGLVATINTEKIKENLLGKPRSDFNPIINSFPAVVTASVSIQPFWNQTFPTNPQNITISVNQP